MTSVSVTHCCRILEGFCLYSLRSVLLFVFISLSACAFVPHVPNETEFKSPGGSKSALVKNGMVIVDGNKSTHIYDGIFSAGVRFSPDDRHFAYVGDKKGKLYLVVDDVEYGPYDDVAKEGVLFSPSENAAYLAVVQDGKWAVVIDGREGEKFDDIGAGSPVFSDDGSHWAYSARRGDKWVLVSDGVVSKEYNGTLKGTPLFTSTGKLVYGSLRYRRWIVHIDDWASEPYDDILVPWIILSPDRSKAAFVGVRDGKKIAVIEGEEETPYENIGFWKTSGSGMSTSYMFLGGYSVMPIHTGAPVRNDLVSSIIFSPDSRHYAYPAVDDKGVKIIADGVVVKEFPEKSILEQLEFRDDSKSLMYKVKDKGFGQVIELQDP